MASPIVGADIAIYMLWRQDRSAPTLPATPAGYDICNVASEDIEKGRPVLEMDGALSDPAWRCFRNSVVPDGMFLVQERTSFSWVGTISAVHNPGATRFYFPGGGELGYLFVAPGHRRKGLGFALIGAAVRRLHAAGYRHIFLGVQS